MAESLTASNIHDSTMLPTLLDDIEGPIRKVSSDTGYDTRASYEAVLDRGAVPAIIPRRNARRGERSDESPWRATRDQTLRRIRSIGRYTWRVESGCTRQAIAENAISRFKTLFGATLAARRFDNQRVEARVKCAAMNRLVTMGIPKSERAA